MAPQAEAARRPRRVPAYSRSRPPSRCSTASCGARWSFSRSVCRRGVVEARTERSSQPPLDQCRPVGRQSATRRRRATASAAFTVNRDIDASEQRAGVYVDRRRARGRQTARQDASIAAGGRRDGPTQHRVRRRVRPRAPRRPSGRRDAAIAKERDQHRRDVRARNSPTSSAAPTPLPPIYKKKSSGIAGARRRRRCCRCRSCTRTLAKLGKVEDSRKASMTSSTYSKDADSTLPLFATAERAHQARVTAFSGSVFAKRWPRCPKQS